MITQTDLLLADSRSVTSDWREGLCCDVTAGQFNIIVDEPVSVGGTNLGPQPTDLMLAAIASCFTIALAYSAKKLSIELEDISVKATGTYDGPQFSAICVEGQLHCDAADVEPLVRAAKRICYVTNTLNSDVDLRIDAVASGDKAGQQPA